MKRHVNTNQYCINPAFANQLLQHFFKTNDRNVCMLTSFMWRRPQHTSYVQRDMHVWDCTCNVLQYRTEHDCVMLYKYVYTAAEIVNPAPVVS